MLGKPSKRLKKHLEENGVHSQAKVLEVAEKGMAVTSGAEGVVANTTLALKCKLEITPEDGTPAFQITERFRFSQFAVPTAGQTVAVIYDPADHGKLILDESPDAVQGAALAGAGLDPNTIQDAMKAAQQWQQQGAALQAGQFGGMPQAPAAAPAAADPVAQLEKLQALKEKGALTDAEFEAEKAKILGGS
jgi:hypothetical protein